jgi:hypothetical protein
MTSPKVSIPTPVSDFQPFNQPVTPELEGLKYQPELTQPFAQPEQPYSAGIDVGLSEKERTNIFNTGRGRIQTATNVAMEQMKETLGEKGFRPGDSGLADTILGKIAIKGQSELSDWGRQIESQESIRRFMESLSKGKFGLEEQRFGLEGEKFEYGQAMESIKLLMSLFGMGQQNQQSAYSPYWQSILSYGGQGGYGAYGRSG